MLLIILSLATCIITTAAAIEAIVGMRSLKRLGTLPMDNSPALPSLSIIVAARNEEKNIREGLQSLLNLVYPSKQLIVVNDRSTDNTGNILAELTSQNPQMRVVSVTDLPAGWLGKNHALWAGSIAATGDLLLFSDADIVMDKTTLLRAIPYFEKNQLDHLAIGPKAVMPGLFLNIFMAGFGVFFNLFVRPWRVGNTKSPTHVGIGAFNLIRANVYKSIGTHQAIAMRPDDDLKLGKLVKKFGFRQGFLVGVDLISVEWYTSVKELIEGLMKNAFSGTDYKVSIVIAGTFMQLAVGVWPFLAIFVTSGLPQLLYFIAALTMIIVCALSAHAQNMKWTYGFGFPLASLAFAYILWKATLRTLIRGGIEWRGTFYPLKELKKNVV